MIWSSSSGSTAPASDSVEPSVLTMTKRRLIRHAEAVEHVARVVADLRERQAVLVDELLERVVVAGPRHADEVGRILELLGCLLDRGGFTVAPASSGRPEPEHASACRQQSAPVNSPPPTSGAVNCSASGTTAAVAGCCAVRRGVAGVASVPVACRRRRRPSSIGACRGGVEALSAIGSRTPRPRPEVP